MAWLWEAVTVAARACSTGTGGGTLGAIGFLVLLLAVPVTIGRYGRRARPLLRILIPVIVSVLLAVPAILVGAQVWWYDHDCYT